MSKTEVDIEEQSFLKEVTSHLPLDWSDERRDAYIQHVLISWRQHREHSREEQRLMEKYLSTIQQHFKPQSSELYDFNQWPINENLLAMLNRDSIDSDIVKQIESSGAYTFSFLPTTFCQLLINEIAYFEQWCIDNGLKLYRPNSMNKYGVILDHFGFEKCLTDIVTNIVQPLTRLIYKHITLPLDSHHGFIVEYAMDKDKKLDFHVDDAAVTLNLCLGEEFTGGQLYFGGIRCSSHTSTTPPKHDEEIYLEHQVGTACLHLGNHRHRALPITSGRRLNLILWCRSSNFDDERKKNGNNECPTWCGFHQMKIEENV
ncbi:unnamed protein product [Rotaria sordida]|uniref:Fe2OG dioxygenase domain-containing protein n=1 Tax=Rotaria sordida TaxID=392033 RepID=A0A814Y914_9BILA|nr:unnamed protein product [Rotaria sordida]CAF1064034.1 unnamed protein product [Rotaria sordida]CAF1226045.1 unnamed protein product [Rotaria sordida]CAF1238840.1 unnamed protein product [Rotaria sordida]CAF1263720.1 unnamed protein product [Rotaria sordida]